MQFSSEGFPGMVVTSTIGGFSAIVTSTHNSYSSESTGINDKNWNAFIGIVTSIVGNVLISFALNLQRYAHIRLHRDSLRRSQSWANGKRKVVNGDVEYGRQIEIAEERAEMNQEAIGDETMQAPSRDERIPVQDSNSRRSSRSSRSSRSNHSSHSSVATGKNTNTGSEVEDDTNYLRSPYWWAGILLMITGEAGNFLAYVGFMSVLLEISL